MDDRDESPVQETAARERAQTEKEGPEHVVSWDAWDELQRKELKERELAKLERRRERQLEKERLEKAARAEQRRSMLSSLVLFVLGLLSLGAVAFLFRGSMLAAVPLLGMALFAVCWIPFQKFSKLERFEAVFEPTGLRLGVSNQKNELSDQYARLQSKKAELEVLAVEKRIELLEAEKKATEEKRVHRLGPGTDY